MSNFNKVRVTNRGKSVEVRDLKPSQPAVAKPEPKSEVVSVQGDDDPLERNVARLGRMFGLGQYGYDLAREILLEVYNSGHHMGVAEAIEHYGLDN